MSYFHHGVGMPIRKQLLVNVRTALILLTALLGFTATHAMADESPLWVELPKENLQVAPGQYRLPLNMVEPSGVDRVNEASRFGVPMPRGVLRNVANVKLEDEQGRERALQIEPAAFWPDGSYKWIIIDTKLDLPAHAKATWHLSVGDKVKRAEPQSTLRVTEDDDAVTVDTGVLKFVLLKERNEFIHAAWLDRNGDGQYSDDEQIITPPVMEETRGLFVDVHRVRNAVRWRHGDGMHWAVIAPKPEQFKIETAGPLCAEFKYEGWHHSDKSYDMDPWVNVAASSFKYVLRIRAYAGSSTLRVYHTFINTDDPLDTRARSIGLTLPLNLKDKPQYTFGSNSEMQTDSAEPHYLVQDHWDSFQLGKVVSEGNKLKPTTLKQGQVSEGWADISDKRAGLTMVFRDMVKLFPKELGFNGNNAIAYAWPAHKGQTDYEYFWGGNGSEMDLRQPNELDSTTVNAFKTKYPEAYQQFMVGSDTDWERYKLVPDRCNAIGTGKTHELLYDFHTGSVDPQRARNLALAASDPIQPYVTPQWYCWATEVFGRMQPYDPVNFPALELTFDRFVQWCFRHQNEWSKLWGMFDYGDFQTFYKPKGYPEEFGPWGKLMGRYGWLNGEYNNDFEFFLSYMRTGRYADFKIASAYAAHRMDVDTCNYHPNPAWVGAQHRHGILHWSDWLIDQQTFSDGIAALYYTTGDRRARDIALQTGDFAMYDNHANWYDKYSGNFSEHRGSWTRLANIARAYEINPTPKTLTYIDRFIDMVNQHLEPFGGPRDPNGTVQYMGAAFPLAYLVTDNPKIRKLITETGYTYGDQSVLGNFGAYFALQYHFTQDKGLFTLAAIPTTRRMGTPESLETLKNTPLAADSFSSGRNSMLGSTYHMAVMYDAKYDDRRKIAPATLPVAQDDAHYQMIDLRPVMNRDAFGHTTSGTPLPWPEEGKILGTRQPLMNKGGKLVFCGSANHALAADQEISSRLKPGELAWSNWTSYPSTGLSLPTLRSNSPPPSLWNWGPVNFDIVDSRYNQGRSMIGVQGPATVSIPINRKARKLYFLGHVFAVRYDQPLAAPPMLALLAERQVGSYRVRYSDGSVQEVSLINRQNMTPWIYGQAAPAAPFVYGSLGGYNNVWPYQGGVAAYELQVDPVKQIETIDFVSSDPHKELFLYAITALVDGASPTTKTFKYVFGPEASRIADHEVIKGIDAPAAEQSGWLDAHGVQILNETSRSVTLTTDGQMPVLRLRVPADGWYRVQPRIISQHDAVSATVFANGVPVLNHRMFNALAKDGVIDLTFLCRYPLNNENPKFADLTNVDVTPLATPPAFTTPVIDPADLVKYGWVSPNGSKSGAMRDATMRISPPPGKYRLSIKFTPYGGNTGVKLDLTPNGGEPIHDHLVHGAAAVMEVTSTGEGIIVEIKVDAANSTGRVQTWGLDRVELERLDGPDDASSTIKQ